MKGNKWMNYPWRSDFLSHYHYCYPDAYHLSHDGLQLDLFHVGSPTSKIIFLIPKTIILISLSNSASSNYSLDQNPLIPPLYQGRNCVCRRGVPSKMLTQVGFLCLTVNHSISSTRLVSHPSLLLFISCLISLIIHLSSPQTLSLISVPGQALCLLKELSSLRLTSLWPLVAFQCDKALAVLCISYYKGTEKKAMNCMSEKI